MCRVQGSGFRVCVSSMQGFAKTVGACRRRGDCFPDDWKARCGQGPMRTISALTPVAKEAWS